MDGTEYQRLNSNILLSKKCGTEWNYECKCACKELLQLDQNTFIVGHKTTKKYISGEKGVRNGNYVHKALEVGAGDHTSASEHGYETDLHLFCIL